MTNLESRIDKGKKVIQAAGGLAAFLAGWRYNLWIADEAMMVAGAYLMYKGRDTIDYLKAACGRRR